MQMYPQRNRCTDSRMGGRVEEGWTEGRTDRRTDGWMKRRVDMPADKQTDRADSQQATSLTEIQGERYIHAHTCSR